MLLCEFILNSTQAPPGEEFLYHTLLELHLMGHEDEPPQLPRTSPTGAATASAQNEGAATALPSDLSQQNNQVNLLHRESDIQLHGIDTLALVLLHTRFHVVQLLFIYVCIYIRSMGVRATSLHGYHRTISVW